MEGHLNDLADGTIAPAERAAVEAHLAGCAACRAALEDLEGLVAKLSALPRTSEPSRDLWPNIRPGGRQRPRFGAPRRHPLITGPHLALAAAILIAVSALVTALVLRERPAGPVGPVAPVAPAGAVDVAAAEADLARATATLLDALHRHRDDLPAETVAEIETNLRIVDQAIGEARAALARDPSNARLGHLVAATYQRKLDLIQGASRLPSHV
ncbi:MAG: zf-HC2 domain-containing protein [Acidobacteria bacterium]|nr:zf-HC2 domain-containing protein [Acidobacteriota bacterium]